MTPREFKAWFEGFSENIDGTPSQKQWDKIVARVKEIDGQETTWPVFVERYWDRYRPYWSSRSGTDLRQLRANPSREDFAMWRDTSSTDAFRMVGRAEASE